MVIGRPRLWAGEGLVIGPGVAPSLWDSYASRNPARRPHPHQKSYFVNLDILGFRTPDSLHTNRGLGLDNIDSTFSVHQVANGIIAWYT